MSKLSRRTPFRSAPGLGVETLEHRLLLSELTVITHGRQTAGVDGQREPPPWVFDMASAINQRAGYRCSDAQIRNSRFEGNLDGDEQQPSGSCPRLLVFDWADESFFPGTADNDDVAGRLASRIRLLLDTLLIVNPQERLNIHFIGHSRGAYVNHETIERLGFHPALGFLQMTVLDAQAYHKFRFGVVVDPDGPRENLTVPRAVDFADNYYQKHQSFRGASGIGAREVALTEIVEDWSTSHNSHTEVHDWYHWTINLSSQAEGAPRRYADVPNITADQRAGLLYADAPGTCPRQPERRCDFEAPTGPDDWAAGTRIGYYYSLMGGGLQARQPETSGVSVIEVIDRSRAGGCVPVPGR